MNLTGTGRVGQNFLHTKGSFARISVPMGGKETRCRRFGEGGRGSTKCGDPGRMRGERRGRSALAPSPSGSEVRRGWGVTDPNLGEDALLLEGAGDERLELHHLPRVVVHVFSSLPSKRPPSLLLCARGGGDAVGGREMGRRRGAVREGFSSIYQTTPGR